MQVYLQHRFTKSTVGADGAALPQVKYNAVQPVPCRADGDLETAYIEHNMNVIEKSVPTEQNEISPLQVRTVVMLLSQPDLHDFVFCFGFGQNQNNTFFGFTMVF